MTGAMTTEGEEKGRRWHATGAKRPKGGGGSEDEDGGRGVTHIGRWKTHRRRRSAMGSVARVEEDEGDGGPARV